MGSFTYRRPRKGFNTQPPEGGWSQRYIHFWVESSFNTQPPEGGWALIKFLMLDNVSVSTHSRLKAAGQACIDRGIVIKRVSTHSRLKAAGLLLPFRLVMLTVSTHSRLKAAGFAPLRPNGRLGVSTHSRLKAAGPSARFRAYARRFNTQPPEGGWHDFFFGQFVCIVSTHSRLKAAGTLPRRLWCCRLVSTHSRLKAAGS